MTADTTTTTEGRFFERPVGLLDVMPKQTPIPADMAEVLEKNLWGLYASADEPQPNTTNDRAGTGPVHE
jgi:hypothetical protein